MSGCYIGRGSLLLSVLGGAGGFFPLSNVAEVKLEFTEDNESVLDARNGVHERVDWYVRNRGARLTADCFGIDDAALENLLKATKTAVVGAPASWDLPDGVTLGQKYLLAPNLQTGTVAVEDSVAAPVDAGDYVVDLDYGLIHFVDVTGYNQPFTVSATTLGHTAYALQGKNQLLVAALFKGVNTITGQKILAEFYRLALNITQSFPLLTKGFSNVSISMEATPDVSQTADPAVGQYGRIMLL